jgi:hypothetical protein
MAPAAADAVRLPLNLSGAINTRIEVFGVRCSVFGVEGILASEH